MKSLAKYVLFFCMAFSLAGAAGYIGVGLFTRSAPEVIIPDLVGKNIIQVLETLTRMGLNPKFHNTQYHETIPKYGITFQDPAPGATIKKGRDVLLYISKGFKETRVPDLRKIGLKQGLLNLEANELRPGRIVYVHSCDTQTQSIISQVPLPHAAVAANTRCDLLVSKGPKPIALVMPDLKKASLESASARIKSLSLFLGEIRSQTAPNRPLGQVLGQTPAFGTRVLEGTPVHLVVNHSRADAVMDPAALQDLIWISYRLPFGFSNRHVRVAANIFGTDLIKGEADFFNGFMKPGKNINLLIPGEIKTKIKIFVDDKLIKFRTIDPWRKTTRLPWEYAPLNHFTGETLWL